jgi:hypothetical protein
MKKICNGIKKDIILQAESSLKFNRLGEARLFLWYCADFQSQIPERLPKPSPPKQRAFLLLDNEQVTSRH